MSKQHVKHFERLSSQVADIDELVSAYRGALYKIGYRRPLRMPKNTWESAQWLFRHFHDSFLRLQKKPGKKKAKSASTPVHLSGREREVLRWSAAGLTRREIARTIALSFHTVDFHIRKILRKLDATNMLVAVSKAQHLGLIAFEPRKTDARIRARRERAEKYRRAKVDLSVKRRRAALRKMS
jgi:DNA-binding CsgD family transcriptional regulator